MDRITTDDDCSEIIFNPLSLTSTRNTSYLKSNNMRQTFFGIIAATGLLLGACNTPPGLPQNVNFNHGWRFHKSDDTLMHPPVDATWDSVSLPHTANVEPLVIMKQWQGICYYEKQFKVSPDDRDKTLSLQFDAAMNVADVWVNDQHMTRHLGGYLPFVIQLNDVIRFDTINTIRVRLDNRDNPVTGPKPMDILDFNMYGGIYRNVHLLVKNPVHLTNPITANTEAGGGVFFATTQASTDAAQFHIKSQVKNAGSTNVNIHVVNLLIDDKGQTVGSYPSETVTLTSGAIGELPVTGSLQHPRLWSPSQPALYTLKTQVFANGILSDEQMTRVGIRTIKITNEGLWINGEKTFLRGVNRHQEYPHVGYALSDAAQYRDAYKIKQAGFDYVRASHYPMSPAFMHACDELGIMVLDAILGWQYFGDDAFEKLALQSSRELIRRDRNHPCVLAWELSINETTMPASFMDSASIIAHREYPFNSCYSAGWVRQAYDIYIEARQHRHGLYPDKPLLVSEYGDWEYYAQNAGFNQEDWQDLLEEERTSRQPRESGEKRMLQQAINIQEAHNDNLSTHAFGDGYWVMYDYNRGMAPDHEYSGIMDIFRLPKFSYYFFQSQRSVDANRVMSAPMVFAATYWQPGISNSVRVFSNCDEVELLVDNRSMGRQKPDQNNISNHLHHPPFTFDVACTQPGTIKAIGYLKGKAVAEHTVTTAGEPQQLTIIIDESGKAPHRNDVIIVHATVADANNMQAHLYNEKVTFDVEGAQVIGPAHTQARAGIASIIIRTGNIPEKISIKATTGQITAKPIQINVQ